MGVRGEVDHGSMATREENRVKAQHLLIRHRGEIQGMLECLDGSKPFSPVFGEGRTCVPRLLSDYLQPRWIQFARDLNITCEDLDEVAILEPRLARRPGDQAPGGI